jgi:hypothetical protein
MEALSATKAVHLLLGTYESNHKSDLLIRNIFSCWHIVETSVMLEGPISDG